MPSYRNVFVFLFFILIQNNIVTKAGMHSPILDISATSNKYRNIGEIGFMFPVLQGDKNLFLVDTKLKNDNRKSREYNVGLVYRHNVYDKWIFGFYNYFDRRKTQHNLYVNQWTVGVEALSDYIDARLNLYIPENKKKLISTSSVEFTRNHTQVYGIKNNSIYEHPLPGYDIEIGTPLFILSPKMNQIFDTKFYVSKYHFHKKGVAKNSGVRLRIEQPVKKKIFNKRDSEMTLFFGTDKAGQRKWNNFAGLNIRISLGYKPLYSKKAKIQKRMMDAVIRDIDIVTSKNQTYPSAVPLYWNNQEIQNIYFVGDANDDKYIGDGSYEKPFSKKQLLKLKNSNKFQHKNTDLVVPVKLDKELNDFEYYSLITECSTLDTTQNKLVKFKTAESTFHMEKYFPRMYSKSIPVAHKQNINIPTRPQDVPEQQKINNIDMMEHTTFEIKKEQIEINPQMYHAIMNTRKKDIRRISKLPKHTSYTEPEELQKSTETPPYSPRTKNIHNAVTGVGKNDMQYIYEKFKEKPPTKQKKQQNPTETSLKFSPRTQDIFDAVINTRMNKIHKVKKKLEF